MADSSGMAPPSLQRRCSAPLPSREGGDCLPEAPLLSRQRSSPATMKARQLHRIAITCGCSGVDELMSLEPLQLSRTKSGVSQHSAGHHEGLPHIPEGYEISVLSDEANSIPSAIPSPSGSNQALTRFMELLAWDWEWTMFDNPVYGSQAGFHDYDDHLQRMDPHSFQHRAAHARHLREMLQQFLDARSLPERSLLHCRILSSQLQEEEDAISIGAHLVLMINAVGHGGIIHNLVEAVAWMNTEESKDFDLIRRRLEAFPLQVHGFIALLRESVKAGFRPPAAVVSGIPDQLKKHIASVPQEFLELEEMPADPVQRRELRDAIRLGWIEGINLLLQFLEEEYVPKAMEESGLCAQPRGNSIYAAYLRHHTTSSLTPEEVHVMGLEEVRRIQTRYREDVFQPLGHQGNLSEFVQGLKGDPQHFYTSADDLIRGYERINEKIANYLPQFFEKIPAAKMEVVPRSDGPACIYIAGTVDFSRPGRFFVNTDPLEARPRYEQVAFALHEGSPGHHLQNSLCIENQGLPNFLRLLEERRYEWIPARRQAYTAYQEGWALYCEALGEEMGEPCTPAAVYETPYDIFGKLSMEMKRAVRLVVDTGIHHYGWSIDKATSYMISETGMHQVECERECRRYAAWPAQAVSYKVGQLRFQRLRQFAENELGSDFDIKWFHSQCLDHGPMPLDILEDLLTKAVAARKRPNQ